MGSIALQGQFLHFTDLQVPLGHLILVLEFTQALHFAPLHPKTADSPDFTQSKLLLQNPKYYLPLLPRTKRVQKKYQILTHSELTPSPQEPPIRKKQSRSSKTAAGC